MSGSYPPVDSFGQMVGALIKAMFDIWGVNPNRQEGSFAFQTDPYPIVGSATLNAIVPSTIQVSTAGAFILTKHSVYSTTYDFAITWQSGGSDRRWTSRSGGGHVNNLGGTGVWPFIYPKPYIWDGGTTVSASVQSLTANSRNVYWDFVGWRIWDVAALDLTRRAG